MKMKIRLLIATVTTLALASMAGAQTTVQNLNHAYQAESNAANRYRAFAKQAETENLPQAAKLFRAAAFSEEIHRKIIERSLQKIGGRVETFKLDEITLGSTAGNLRRAIEGETTESGTAHPGFLASAKADNLKPAIRAFDYTSECDKKLAGYFQQTLDNLDREVSVPFYLCRDCGLLLTQLPEKKCPVCREGLKEFDLVN